MFIFFHDYFSIFFIPISDVPPLQNGHILLKIQVKTMLSTFGAISRTGSGEFGDALADGVVMDWAPGIFRVLQAVCQLYVPWMLGKSDIEIS